MWGEEFPEILGAPGKFGNRRATSSPSSLFAGRASSFFGKKNQKPFVNPEVPWSQTHTHQKTVIAAFGGYQNTKVCLI